MTSMNWYAAEQLIAERTREIEHQAHLASQRRALRGLRRSQRRAR